ncbi:MAG: helix-turn-helix domain-containing protein [Alphaproteobacteria bacterium]|nr:helix-turn-helix domain-containing protein [Alphaproteobacteria bacterium]MBF0391928.1 helix-turn-helix domain-containing protein [Alphaproteobacteria bacterium]
MSGRANYDTVMPSEVDARLAEESSRVLASHAAGGALRVQLDDGSRLTLPHAATRLLTHVLAEMAAGNAVTLIPIHAEMTTQEAADHLNVSRPFLIGLLDRGEIPHHRVGTHRRVRFEDVKDYKDRIDVQRRAVLDQLAAEAQDLGLGY